MPADENAQHVPLGMPAPLRSDPGDAFDVNSRRKQGVPTIEMTPGGRLWASWRCYYPYITLATSVDSGQTWDEPVSLIESFEPTAGGPQTGPSVHRRSRERSFRGVRVYDPLLWLDPADRLWWFWNQHTMARKPMSAWARVTENPEAPSPEWSEPRFIAEGNAMNKPIVNDDGTWLLPVANGGKIYASEDRGETWTRRGRVEDANGPGINHLEHMVTRLDDGRLWMLSRTASHIDFGIGQSFSADGGYTWTDGEDSRIPGPKSRFHLRRLKSGDHLLLNHHQFTGRSHLTAMISQDDGRTWPYTLLIDPRQGVSYPDATQDRRGRIYMIHDYAREERGHILVSVFTEDDVRSGGPESPASVLRRHVSPS